MFTLVQHEKEFAHDLGDNIYCDDVSIRIIRNTSKKELIELLQQKHLIKSTFFSFNAFNALAYIEVDPKQVDALQEGSSYVDPFYDTTHYGICPIALICDSIEPYDKRVKYDHYLLEMAHDREWKHQDELVEKLKNNYSGREAATLYDYLSNDYLRLHLGLGYTGMCYPSDGHAGMTIGLIDIENTTDKILCFVREWYNK